MFERLSKWFESLKLTVFVKTNKMVAIKAKDQLLKEEKTAAEFSSVKILQNEKLAKSTCKKNVAYYN